jgi:hypothetical protein
MDAGNPHIEPFVSSGLFDIRARNARAKARTLQFGLRGAPPPG